MRRFSRLATLWIGIGCVGHLTPPDLRAEETIGARDPEVANTSDPTIAPSAAQIEQWISDLSHDSFAVRQSAASRLLAAGMAARESLTEVVGGPDPEARAAAGRLIALIEQSDFHRRLEAFAADTNGRRGLTLPGWDEFRSSVGPDANARALFVEMQRQEGPLLSAVFGARRQSAEQLWQDRLLRLAQRPVSGEDGAPPLGSCAAMLFLGTAVEMSISDHLAMQVENMIQRPPLRDALATGGTTGAVRRLISDWILNCPNENEHILTRRLNLASAIDLEEVLPLALDVASGDPQYASVPPTTQAQAILLVGQFGGRKHLRHLEPLLDDATVCMPLQAQQLPGKPAVNVQIRDVALVVMLHLTGQRPADYGYVHARLQPQRTFALQTLHRENDEQRAAAAAKWRAWRAEAKAAGGQ